MHFAQGEPPTLHQVGDGHVLNFSGKVWCHSSYSMALRPRAAPASQASLTRLAGVTPAPVDPLIGHTLDGRYVIRSRIARGGMAVVYLANDLRLERRVAVKVMHGHLIEDENFVRRFEQEARSAARLADAHVVGVFDQGIDQGLPYLVMEYLPGITLRDLLKQQGQLTNEQAREISEAVLSGLAAAHTAGIVHRDLKPENVLLADDGRIKIGDFGLARAVSAHTTTGQALLGTIAYLSPELVTRGVADARSDLYAFGIMLFEMLTGQQPFQGEQAMQIAYQHAHGEVPAPSQSSPGIDPTLDALVRWLTTRDPEGRPSDAREALEALHHPQHLAQRHLEHTRALPATGIVGDTVTPSTAVLQSAEQQALAGPNFSQLVVDQARPHPPSATVRAASIAQVRRRRGRLVAGALALLLVLAGGVGFWFGQGPGSMVTIPNVAGQEIGQATLTLTELSLTVEVFDCASLEIAPGLAAQSEPAAGSQVDRGSGVTLCRSTGPELLPVPTLIGLSADEAKQAITDADFTFGSVLEQRFDGQPRNTVIAALDLEGIGVGSTYPQRGTINLIVSAGSIPTVNGTSVAAATSALSDAGLTVDSALNAEAHSDSVELGLVIEVITHTDPVRTGDTVGLRTSQGPQLYAVPDVSGMRMRKAVETLQAAGFTPVTSIPEVFWGAISVSGSKPGVGEMLPKGTKVELQIDL